MIDDKTITIHWNNGYARMIVNADKFFPLTVDRMKKFDRLILRIADTETEVRSVLAYLKETALPLWEARAKDKADKQAARKLKQVKQNIQTVENTLDRF